MTRPLRVMIVEDEALIALQLEDDVEQAGCTVVGCASASQEALTLARAMQPDLALLDVHLADGPTGVELGRRLRAEGCEVVFVTANAKRVPADLAATAGVLGKPYSAGALQRQLHGAHERRGQGAGLSAGP